MTIATVELSGQQLQRLSRTVSESLTSLLILQCFIQASLAGKLPSKLRKFSKNFWPSLMQGQMMALVVQGATQTSIVNGVHSAPRLNTCVHTKYFINF